jgi:glycosyltransferase involved in cell wall biosynthesis
MSSLHEGADAGGAQGRRQVGLISLRGTDQKVNASAYFIRRALDRWVGDTTHLGDRFRVPIFGARVARWSGCVSEEVYLKRAQRHLRRAPQDLIFGLYSGSTLAMFEPTSTPMVYVTDGAAHDLVDTYPQFTDLPKQRIAEILRLEEEGIARCAMIVTHTEWSARSLIERAGAAPERVVIAPPGIAPENIIAGFEPRPIDPEGTLEAVFVGRDWERKGLPQALAAIELLNSRGIPAHISVLGCTPPKELTTEHSTFLGPFNPNEAEEFGRYERALIAAHVHLLPSRAECFGTSIAEAGAYCTPSIVTNSQGLPEAVIHGETGTVISGEGGVVEELAEVMAGWYADPKDHLKMCRGVRRDVEERLNWDVWGQTVARELEARSL